MGRASSSLATRLGLALAVAWLAPTFAHAQDAGVAPVDDPEPAPDPDDDDVRPVDGDADTALPPLSLSESALAAGSEHDEEEEDDDAILVPTERPRPSDEELLAEEEAERANEEPDGEPAIIDDDMELPPDPVDLPDFRLRAGTGVALATAGDFPLGVRITEDFEWQPGGFEPFFVGVSGAEIVFPGQGVAGSVRARVGLHAWFCEARPLRCQAGIAFVGGASFGFGIVSPDIAGEIDFRFLFWDRLELHLRGGFSFLGPIPFIDITGGIGVAF